MVEQDGGILVYSPTPQFVSTGVLFPSADDVASFLLLYRRDLQTHGFRSPQEFWRDSGNQIALDGVETPNRQDSQSAYFINAASGTDSSGSSDLVGKYNLLIAARQLEVRADVLALTDELDVTDHALQHYLKRKAFIKSQFPRD
tara:strand:+ start:229440 stop:229871 length:432 start_codon:yes stop_codon:yes gene_type:complete